MLLWTPLLMLACGHDPVVPPAPMGLVINEVMASNDASWLDPDAEGCPEADDWIELYNASAEPVDVEGWGLTDDPTRPARLILPPGTLAPGDRLQIVADGQPEQGPLHAPFALDADGESLVLTDPAGAPIDTVSWSALLADQAYGRIGDAGDAWGVQATPTPGSPNLVRSDDPCLAPPLGFDDHTFPCLSTLDGYRAIAATRLGMQVAKFDILSFADPAARHVVFLDSAFYELHDEWYLFRMFNGRTVPGELVYRPYHGDFPTIDAIYAWAQTHDLTSAFPEDVVRWAGARLTSPRYYNLAMAVDPPAIGVGVLLRVPPAADRPERWAFELEFADQARADDITVYFDVLQDHLPPEIAADLRWLLRSPQHEQVAQEMAATGHAYADRVLRYADITTPGEVQVYNPGLAAGRVRVLRGDDLTAGDADDLLVLAAVPDALPAAVGLLTDAPQTPLAHVSLLAESRGIPNAFVDGITKDPQWDQWGRVRAWVAVRATAPDRLDTHPMTTAEVAAWGRVRTPSIYQGEPADLSDVGWTMDPAQVPIEDMARVRPAIGGKSAGFIALLSTDGVETPDAPLAITVTPYLGHIRALPWLTDVLATPDFVDPAASRARHLVLEGTTAFLAAYDRPADVAWLASFAALHPPGDLLGDLAASGGVRGRIEEEPMQPDVLAAITAELQARFGHLGPGQALRFRSSSNVEDIEGFNGAGLYASYSGWLDPVAAGVDPARTVERAIKQTWASYWGAEAFEKRRAAGISHTAGAMGVLVHPAFDDAAERANGVITFTRLPEGAADRWQMVVNSQIGAISVTNPEPGDDCRTVLPEVVELRAGEGAPRITRVAASTETGGAVMSDAALLGLFDDVRSVLERWLDAENAALAPAQRRTTFTLDLEFRDVNPGWPELADGTTRPGRVVLKQARPLEPGTGALPDEVIHGPFPRDLAARAAAIDRHTCATSAFVLTTEEVRTDPLTRPDMGHATDPFVARLELIVTEPVPELGWQAGDRIAVDHTQLVASHPAGGAWALHASLVGLGELDLEDGGAWSFVAADGTAAGAVGACTSDPLFATPEAWLAGLFP